MDRLAIRSALAKVHAGLPQRASMADSAISAAFAAIDELAKLGHTFELVEGVKPAPVEFPKMFYKDGPQGLVTVTAASAVEAAKLGKEWRTTPSPKPIPQQQQQDNGQPAAKQ